MSTCIFVGPTLQREEVDAVCDVVCLPPVAQGDVYRVAQHRPRAIGIIDGYFNGAPSVWHKEILWALSQGVQVFGSASMGALRAAELHRYGMRGVGRIFEAYRDGVLEDDDEVAVVHGPAETGFLSACEPMVNIRATLERAERDGVLSASSRSALEIFGKSLFFPQRTWPAILEGASALSISERELGKLRDWLPYGRVDQKRQDALEMLAAIQEALKEPDPPPWHFRFECTNFWNKFVARAGPQGSAIRPPSGSPHEGILEELRLEGDDAYGRVKDRALFRLLANLEAQRLGLEVSQEAKRDTLSRMRAGSGLLTRAELESWLARNCMDMASLERLIDQIARADAVTRTLDSLSDHYLLDELRLSGAYERLDERARRKRDFLAGEGLGGAACSRPGPNAVARRLWYFERRLGRPVPDDIGTFIRELGFAGLDEFDDALQREALYHKKCVA
jgi:hypothetical protein